MKRASPESLTEGPGKPGPNEAESDWRTVGERCGVEFAVSDSELEKIAKNQKLWLARIAGQVESGDSLGVVERQAAAGAIRAFAESIPLKAKRKRGQAARFDHGSEALIFVTLRARGTSPSAAYISIADRVGVEWQAVERAMRKHGPGAARLLEGLGVEGIPNNLFRE